MDLKPMDIIKPINLSTKELDETKPLTSVEMAKLWATYAGNSMSSQILNYFLQHCQDEYIKKLLENGKALAKDFMKKIQEFFTKENFPIPVGFTEEDVNLGAPRLYEDEFYAHYLKYAAKAGMSIYAVANPLVMSEEAIMAANGEEEPKGTLTIGAQESQCTYRLPPILKEFKTRFPNVKLVFKPAHSDEIARKHLIEGLLDVPFIMDISKPEGALRIEATYQGGVKNGRLTKPSKISALTS